MKTRKFILGLMLSVFLVSVGVSSSWAIQYLGETTWDYTLVMDDEGETSASVPMKGAITHMGGAYYTMQACIILEDDGHVIFSGGGVLIEDTLYLSMAESQRHTDGSGNRDTGVMHMQINKDTLNGGFYAVGNDFNINTLEYGEHFSGGTLALTGDPIDIEVDASAALPATNTLLLDDKD